MYFQQEHPPGREAQVDFTHCGELGVTMGGEAFRHLLFHLVESMERLHGTGEAQIDDRHIRNQTETYTKLYKRDSELYVSDRGRRV